jgi:hypothetical protein
MKIYKFATLFVFILFAPLIHAAEEAPDSVKQLAENLRTWGENPILIEAVKAQNAKGLTLDAIKERDSIWRKTSGVDDFMEPLLENAAAKEMSNLENSQPYYFLITSKAQLLSHWVIDNEPAGKTRRYRWPEIRFNFRKVSA